MKAQCPYCGKHMVVRPGQFLGKYLVCLHCHRPFPWQEASADAPASPVNPSGVSRSNGANPPDGGGKPPVSGDKREGVK